MQTQFDYLNPKHMHVVEIHDAFIDQLLFDDNGFDIEQISDDDFTEIDMDFDDVL